MSKYKCPNCGCGETKTTNISNGNIIEETWTVCSDCSRLKYHWAYGTTYVENWRDLTEPPAQYKVGTLIKKLFSRKPKKQKTNNADLPF